MASMHRPATPRINVHAYSTGVRSPLRSTLITAGCITACSLVTGTVVLAQEGRATLEEVTVTGSRIQQGGFTAPTPVTVMNRDMLEDLGIVNMGEAVAQLPSNVPAFSPSNVGLGNFNVGAQLANLRGLNPFFGTRTLTLVDGHRFVPSTNGGSVDMNLIPSNLVARTEIVTGGASAAYGSDAIAGVVNVILDHELEGIRAQVDYGETAEGDGENLHVGIAGGTELFGGRGHIVVGGEYDDAKNVGDCFTRSWCKPWAVVNNETVPGSAPYFMPDWVLVDNSISTRTLTGRINTTTRPGACLGGLCTDLAPPPSLANMQFNDAGTALVPWQPGEPWSFGRTSTSMSGGAGVPSYTGTYLRVPVERFATYARFQYDITEQLQAFAEVSYGGRKASNSQVGTFTIGGTSPVFGGAHISVENAFLPDSVVQLLQSAGKNGFFLDRHNLNLPAPTNNTKNETYRTVVGLEGKLAGSWTWDSYYTYGRNDEEQRLAGSRITPLFNFAIDAVVDPSTGQIRCRALVSDPTVNPGGVNPAAAGCEPLNLFGLNNASEAALDFAFGTQIEDFIYKQHVVGVNFQGELLDGWAGPVFGAIGAEYRRENGEVTHGGFPSNYWYPEYGADFAGKVEVIEGYVEGAVPLLDNAPAADGLELNVAIRQAHNTSTDESGSAGASRSFDITTWKASLVWDVTDWLRLRGTRSRDIRAPGFRELFSVGTLRESRVANPWVAGSPTDVATSLGTGLYGGNVDLDPEVADSWTLGVVFQPQWGWSDGLRLSVDFYEIKIEDAISNPGSQGIVDACFNAGKLCDRLEGVTSGSGFSDITFINAGSLNLETFTTRGIDAELAYNLPLTRLGGNLNFRFLASYLADMLVVDVPGTEPFNWAGQSGAGQTLASSFATSPRLQMNGTVTYANGPLRTTLQARFIGSGAYRKDYIGPDDPNYSPALPNSINDNTVPSVIYYNLSGAYAFGQDESVEVFAVVNNLLDEEPPIAPGGNGFVTNPAFFDIIGRTYRVGVRVKY